MAGFGGAVKLTGESEYRRALNQITQNLKEVSSEMKVVSSQYDKNDKSTQALTARSDALNKALDQQNAKMSTLKAQYESMSTKVAEQSEKHKTLVSEYESEKKKLETLGSTLGKTSQEYKDQQAKVTELASEVKKSTTANDANEKSLSNLRTQMNVTQAEINETARELDNLGKEAKKSGEEAEESSKGYTVFKNVLANLATQAITSAINGLKQLGGAFIDVGKQAVGAFAQFEQLEGGVKKIFGEDDAKAVMENANRAFATAGMSANEYMETVTGFSSSLIQSLGGDTAKATEVADRIIRDMSDNANTFGTDMASIQYTFQGFAKQNYTMLDNLKLGYGGTKEEMQRLIADASKMTDVQKELGITVDESDMSFANIANAISVVQKNMGIMGTTAKEASGTIEGSTSSMKSAWKNMLTGMANENANFEQLASDFIGTLVTEDGKGGVFGTLVPRITTVITGMSNVIQTLLPQLIQAIVPIIQSNLPIILDAVQSALQTILAVLPDVIPVITALIPQIVSMLISMLPQLVDTGVQILLSLIDGISDTIPQLIKMLPTIIKSIVDVLIKNLPQIIKTGVELLVGLIEGLNDAIPELIDYIPEIIETIVNVLLENLPLILKSAGQILGALIEGLIVSLPKLVQAVPKIITTINDTLSSYLQSLVKKGGELLLSLISGLNGKIGELGRKAGEIGQTIIKTVSELPSKMIEIGGNLVSGIWSGISGSYTWIKNKIKGWVGNVTSFIKGLFGIHSPSTLFRDEIGENLALGIGEGFSDEMQDVSKMMADSIPQSFDISPAITGAKYDSGSNSDMVTAFKEALSQMKIVLDDEVAGKFVEDTVSRAIYA